MNLGKLNADERDRWCMRNGEFWTVIPTDFDQDAEDRLIIDLRPDSGPRVVGPTTGVGWVSIAGLMAVTRLGRFKVDLVVQYPREALAIADALQRAVAEQEDHRRSPRAFAARKERLSPDEMVALLDSRPTPRWTSGLSANAQRLCALIDSAVEGTEWALPYVFPDDLNEWRREHPVIGIHEVLWTEVLGGSAEEARMAAMSLLEAFGREFGRRGRFVRWVFDT